MPHRIPEFCILYAKLNNAAIVAQSQGDLAQARQLYDQSLALARELGDKQGIARTLHQLGWLAQATGDLAQARQLYDQSLALKRELGDKRGIAQTLHQLGRLAEDAGDLSQARQLYDQSLALSTNSATSKASPSRCTSWGGWLKLRATCPRPRGCLPKASGSLRNYSRPRRTLRAGRWKGSSPRPDGSRRPIRSEKLDAAMPCGYND